MVMMKIRKFQSLLSKFRKRKKYAVLGKSGSGKSILLRLIAGLVIS